MDDNAQNLTVPTTSTVPDSTAQNNSAQADDNTNQPSSTPPQAATRPVEKPDKKQQISVGGHPEQGSVFIDTEEDDDDEEEKKVAKQEVKDHKETPMVGQASHPEVILPPEVKEAGVEKGEDEPHNLPEEQQKLEIAVEQPAPVEVPVEQAPLPMPYAQAVQDQKAAGSPKNARKWWLTEVIREWKKKF